MALIDSGIVWIALRRATWLVWALCGFLIEQLVVNGPFAWREAVAGRVDWGANLTIAFAVVALLSLLMPRASRVEEPDHQVPGSASR
jgi:hypothetical protein